jgi:hypothetical protein
MPQSQLNGLEDRQLRFRRLIEIFEAASAKSDVSDRKGELLHIAQHLYSALAEHDRKIAKHQSNPTTLKHLLRLLADFHSRFQDVKLAAFRQGIIPSTIAFQSTLTNIAMENSDGEN